MARKPNRSISFPIIVASVTVALSLAVLAGWILVLVRDREATQELAGNTLVLIAGVISLLTIISVLVMFSVFLVQQIIEGRQQDSFIDSVTHELKSPLASIKLCLETVLRPEITPEQREQLRQMMILDVERLSIFIDDILESSRVNIGTRIYSLQEINLKSLSQRCIESIQQRHRTSKESLSLEAADSLLLRTDATALETIVKNLLDNAVKYSQEPRKINVKIFEEQSKHQFCIEVSDNGIGLEPQHTRRIFERFYRAQTEEVRTRRGTGLGLYVGASLAKSIGGKLSAHSQGLGKGTTMRLVLPTDVTKQ